MYTENFRVKSGTINDFITQWTPKRTRKLTQHYERKLRHYYCVFQLWYNRQRMGEIKRYFDGNEIWLKCCVRWRVVIHICNYWSHAATSHLLLLTFMHISHNNPCIRLIGVLVRLCFKIFVHAAPICFECIREMTTITTTCRSVLTFVVVYVQSLCHVKHALCLCMNVDVKTFVRAF